MSRIAKIEEEINQIADKEIIKHADLTWDEAQVHSLWHQQDGIQVIRERAMIAGSRIIDEVNQITNSIKLEVDGQDKVMFNYMKANLVGINKLPWHVIILG